MTELHAGEVSKRQGQDRALAGADPQWKADMLEVIRMCAADNKRFSSNHVWALAVSLGIPEHSEMRAMGGVWRAAAREGYCVKTTTFPQFEKSENPASNRGPKQIWDSLIFVDTDFG